MPRESSDSSKVEALAYKVKGATILWLANLTAAAQDVALAGAGGDSGMFAAVLDEQSFMRAITDPLGFEASMDAAENAQGEARGVCSGVGVRERLRRRDRKA